MRQQRVWDFFQGWLPLSALPMILPFSTNQQPLKKRKKRKYINFSFLVSLGPVVVIHTQNPNTSVSLFLQSVSFMALETLKKAVMITFSKSGLTSSGMETIWSVSWRGNPVWLWLLKVSTWHYATCDRVSSLTHTTNVLQPWHGWLLFCLISESLNLLRKV